MRLRDVPGDLRCTVAAPSSLVLPTPFCRRFLPFPGPPLLSTGRLRGPSGGPLGAGSPGHRRIMTLRSRGPRVGPLGAPSPDRTDSSIARLRGPSGGPLGAGSPGRTRTVMLRCRGPRVVPNFAVSNFARPPPNPPPPDTTRTMPQRAQEDPALRYTAAVGVQPCRSPALRGSVSAGLGVVQPTLSLQFAPHTIRSPLFCWWWACCGPPPPPPLSQDTATSKLAGPETGKCFWGVPAMASWRSPLAGRHSRNLSESGIRAVSGRTSWRSQRQANQCSAEQRNGLWVLTDVAKAVEVLKGVLVENGCRTVAEVLLRVVGVRRVDEEEQSVAAVEGCLFAGC